MKAYRAQAILLCLSLLSACGGGSLAPGVSGPPSLSLQSIQIVPSQPSVVLGENQQFTATGHYSDGSTKDITASVAWASSDNSVATISGAGFAKSRATGSATISATLSGVAGHGTLTVTNAILVSITITPANPVLILGTIQQFTATGTFSDQSTQDITGSVTWGSSDNSVASISGGGLAAGLALGSLTISATSSSISASTTVNVQLATLSSITIRPKNRRIAMMTSQQFSAIGTYTDGSIRNVTGKVSWTVSDTTVARISKSGRAHGLAPGTTTITAALDSFSASATLEVTDATIVHISVGPSGKTIYQATRLSFTATGLFSDQTTQNITSDSKWSSDNVAVAKIGGGGTATAIGPGTANISATFDGVSGSTPLYVSSATISSISVTPATAVLAPATFVNCVARATFSDGTTQVITNVVNWSSSASSVASVSRGGNVTALSGGSATITAQFASVSGESTITVDSSPLTSLQISPPSASIPQQTGAAFQATGTFADGNTQDLTTFALWTSSAPSVATINTGLVTGLAPGTAIIVAVFNGQVGTADLTVTSATSSSLVSSPAATNFGQSGFTQSTFLADFSDGTTKDVTPWATWTSSPAAVAAVAPAGLATSTGAGTTAVTATGNGLNGTAVLRVHGQTLPPQGPVHALPRIERPMLRVPMTEPG